MIKRIVKLVIKAEHTEDFIQLFQESKEHIAARKGCHSVELLQDNADGRIFFTYSLWEDEDSLNAYRKSALFGDIWPRTKALFDDRPEAWSVNSIA